jgi:hypothetical protein
MPFVINVFRFLDHAAFLHHPLRTSISRGFNTMNGAADSSSTHIGNLPRKPGSVKSTSMFFITNPIFSRITPLFQKKKQ